MIRRLLMTADTVGGVWTYSIELIRALEPHGIEVALVTMGAPLNASQRREIAGLPNLAALHETAYKLEWMDEPWADVRASGELLLQIEHAFRPDVVHLNGYAHAALEWAAPVVAAGHSCVLSWWQAVKGEPAPAEWDLYRSAVARGLAAADRVVTPSRAMLAELERLYGICGGGVIPNARMLRIPAARKERFILSAGRLWDDAKNIAAVAAAAESLPWPVLVAGDDTRPGGARREFPGVRLLGRAGTEEMAGLYARASIYALPARYEPFGLSILEAAMAGCALVLGDIASLRENWEGAAEFVPPDDADALETVLAELIQNGARRGSLQRAALGRSRAFSTDRMGRAYLELYEAAMWHKHSCAMPHGLSVGQVTGRRSASTASLAPCGQDSDSTRRQPPSPNQRGPACAP